jgi:hypothetical protein
MVRSLIILASLLTACSAYSQASHSGEEFAHAKRQATAGVSSSTKPFVQPAPVLAKPLMHFRDISRQAGLTTVPITTANRRYIVDTMSGGGIALFDCNNDGKLDIAVVNDSSIDRYLKGGDLMVTLYQQDGAPGAIHFTDVTKSSGLLTKGWATGVARRKRGCDLRERRGTSDTKPLIAFFVFELNERCSLSSSPDRGARSLRYTSNN